MGAHIPQTPRKRCLQNAKTLVIPSECYKNASSEDTASEMQNLNLSTNFEGKIFYTQNLKIYRCFRITSLPSFNYKYVEGVCRMLIEN